MTFEEYALARSAALVRFARLLTADDHRAEDLVQDVLAKVYADWRRIGAMDQPDLYVRRMLINANRSWWRRATNREVAVAEIIGTASTRDSAADSAERDELWRLIMKLPRGQRAVIVLRYYEDYDDATIADLLHCSQGTVRTQAKRALEKLQRVRPAINASRGDR